MYPKANGSNLIWSEEFTNINTVVDNGGTVAGSYVINNGFTFNGSSNYVSYKKFFGNYTRGSYEVKVNPSNFTGTQLLGLLYQDASNQMSFYWVGKILFMYIIVGGVGDNVWYREITTMVNSVDYHLVFTWNTLTDSYVVYLNGSVVTPTATVAVGNPVIFSTISLGATLAPAAYLNGKMYYSRFYNGVLTAGEASDLYNNSTYSEIDAGKVQCYLPLVSRYNDGTEKTYNIGTGNDCTVGDGTTSTTYPTPLGIRGMSFDNGDYIRSGVTPATTGTIMCLFKPTVAVTDYIMGGEVGSNRIGLVSLSTGELAGLCGSQTTSTIKGGFMNVGTHHTGALTWNTSGTVNLYLDGVSVYSGNAAGSVGSNEIYIGCDNDDGIPSVYFSGNIYFPLIDNKEYSATQIRNLHNKMFNQLNQ
jgi:hypothetical protein